MPNNRANSSPVAAAPHAPIGEAQEHGELDLKQLLDLLRSGKWTIAATVAAVFFLAVVYTVVVAPTYEADGLIEVEEDSKSGSLSQMSDISSLLLGTPVETEAEMQILKSRVVLDPVIDGLNLQIEARPKYFPLIGRAIARANMDATVPVSVPSWLRRYAWGGEKIVVPDFDVPPALLDSNLKMVATADGFVVDIPGTNQKLTGKVGERVSVDLPEGRVSLFVQQLEARPGTRFRLVKYSRQDVLDYIKKHLEVTEQGKQSGVIRVAFQGPEATLVNNVVQYLEDAYLRQNIERRSADAQQSLEFLEKQLPELKQQVDTAQARLNAYQLRNGSVDVTRETQLVLQQGVDLETQRLQLQQQKDEALHRFTPQHPVVKSLNDQMESLQSAEANVKSQFEKLPSKQQEIAGLLRDLDVDTQLYADMLNSVQELQIAKAGTVGNVRIIDRPLQPFKPKSPIVPLVLLLSIVIGTALGSAVVIVQRALLRGVDDPLEVERHLGLATYAMIPYSPRQRRLNSALAGKRGGNYILATTAGEDLAIESIRSLRTSLHFAMLEAANNVVMLTGPAPNLGKSFVSINLGAVIALSGKTVAVVDADLRLGHLNNYISAEITPGIADYVAGNAALDAVLRPTQLKGLNLVCRGTTPPNPAELLMHERFAEMIRLLSERHDYVIVDTPPILAVTDAAIVGRVAGTTLLLLKSAQHPMREIEDALKRLQAAGVVVKGSLFNQVGAKAGSYGYGNYGYTYYKYES